MSWVQKIRQDKNQALKDIYHLYRSDCVLWLQNQFSLREDEAVDVFQMAMLIIYDSAIQDKVKSEHTDVKSFLYGIAKNKAFELLRNKKKMNAAEEHHVLYTYLGEDMPNLNEEEIINSAVQSMEALGDPCKSLLQMYFYQNSSMAEISVKLGYKNTDTAKNQKYKCLKRLQSIYFGHLRNNKGVEK